MKHFVPFYPPHGCEVTPDYGIDEHVEIFDDAGIATGRGFYVQLKGHRGGLHN